MRTGDRSGTGKDSFFPIGRTTWEQPPVARGYSVQPVALAWAQSRQRRG